MTAERDGLDAEGAPQGLCLHPAGATAAPDAHPAGRKPATRPRPALRGAIARRARAAALVCACVALMLAATASAADAKALLWSQGSELALPTSTEEPEAGLLGVSCPAAGACTGAGAVGTEIALASFETLTGGSLASAVATDTIRPIVAAQTTAGWSATSITPPEGAQARKAYVGAISCTAPGNCVAVGAYKLEGVEEVLPMAAFEVGGAWRQASPIALPSGAATGKQVATLTGVSCATPDTCTAVGEYENAGKVVEPIVASETDGTWTQAQGVPLAEGQESTAPASLSSVSCPAAGACVAAGEFTGSGGAPMAIALSEQSGTWGQPRPIPPPGGVIGATSLESVSCAAAGSCTAVGLSEYEPEGGGEPHIAPLAVSETGGAWGQPQALPTSGAPQISALTSVSCVAPGACAAVGLSLTEVPTPSLTALAVSQADGAWEPTEAIAPPANAGAGVGIAGALMSAVSCSGGERCLAAGFYPAATSGGGGTFHAMTATSVAELQAPTAALPTGQVGSAYSGQLSATGGSGARHWSLTSGQLPPGLSLNAETGAISGTPTSAGSWGFVAEVSDPGPPAQQHALAGTITVVPAPPVTTATATPHIQILASRLKAAHGKLAVKLVCTKAPCKGTIKVTETLKRKAHKGKAHKAGGKAKVKTIVLAQGDYKIAAGKVKTVRVKLTAQGKKLLKQLSRQQASKTKHKHAKAKSSKHKHAKTVKAKLTVTLAGGKTQHKRVTIA